MEAALKVLRDHPTGLSCKEIATKVLEMEGTKVTEVRRHITYNRLRHSLAIYERAGVVRNLAPPERRAKKWVLADPEASGTIRTHDARKADLVRRWPRAA